MHLNISNTIPKILLSNMIYKHKINGLDMILTFVHYFLDIDECLTGSHTCDLTALCVNDEGGYHCECLENSSCSLSKTIKILLVFLIT